MHFRRLLADRLLSPYGKRENARRSRTMKHQQNASHAAGMEFHQSPKIIYYNILLFTFIICFFVFISPMPKKDIGETVIYLIRIDS